MKVPLLAEAAVEELHHALDLLKLLACLTAVCPYRTAILSCPRTAEHLAPLSAALAADSLKAFLAAPAGHVMTLTCWFQSRWLEALGKPASSLGREAPWGHCEMTWTCWSLTHYVVGGAALPVPVPFGSGF